MDIDNDLELVRKRFLNIYDQLVVDGKIPEDKNSLLAALKCLDSVGKNALALKKINSEKENNDNSNLLLKEIVNKMSLSNNAPIDESKHIPDLPDNLETPDIIPGELDPLTK